MSFTQQQLVDAYNQMTQERQDDVNFAQQAANKLANLIGRPLEVSAVDENWHWNHGAVTPYTTQHTLQVQLSQYDDWQGMFSALQSAGVQMKPWAGNTYQGLEGDFDVSSDPAFAGRTKLSYLVKVVYYDSHVGGF